MNISSILADLQDEESMWHFLGFFDEVTDSITQGKSNYNW